MSKPKDIKVHTSGELYGEPVIEPEKMIYLPVEEEPYNFPLTKKAERAAMGRETVQKFFGDMAGAEHGESPGDIPLDGTPLQGSNIANTGSVLSVVSASRKLKPNEEQWSELTKNGIVVPPPYDPYYLIDMVGESDTLGPLIDAFTINLTGFGFEIEPLFPTRDEETGAVLPPPPEAEDEKAKLELFIASANVQIGTLVVHQRVDHDVESTGNGYMEILRDRTGEVAGIDHIQAQTMRLGSLSRPILVKLPFRHPTTGELVILPRYQRFRKFIQICNQRVAFFKEYGDPRFINWKTGAYSDKTFGADENGNALDGTEVLHRSHYASGGPYGEPRWIGTSPHVLANRGAGELVFSWFKDAPIGAKLAMIAGGTWNRESMRKALAEIDQTARGMKNPWTIIGIEAEADSSGDPMSETKTSAPGMALENIAADLPESLYKGKDSMIDSNQRRIAKSFRLPPLYWGASDDFSHAAANTARKVTEEQVFIPERETRWLQWWNNNLLPSMGINYWRVRLRGANTSDETENSKGIAGFVQGGGASPNMLIKQWNEMTGRDTPLIPEPWGDRPMVLTQTLIGKGLDPNLPLADIFGEEDEDGNASKKIEGAPGGVNAAQDTALNGAQVTAALAIVERVVIGAITKEMGKAMLQEFFNLPEEAAEQILADSDKLLTEAVEVQEESGEFGDNNTDENIDGNNGGSQQNQQQQVQKKSNQFTPRTLRNLDNLAAILEKQLSQGNSQWKG